MGSAWFQKNVILETFSPRQLNPVLWLDASTPVRQLDAPATAPAAAEGAAGNLNGAYRWAVSFLSASLVSGRSPVSAELTVSSKIVNLSSIPTSTDARVSGRRIWRTAAGGTVYKKVGDIADNVTATYEDNVADGSLGADYEAKTTYVDGDPVERWDDLSPNVNHASQTTAAARPTYKVSILNGRPVVRFDGNDFLSNAGAVDLRTCTIFVVMRVPDVTPNRFVLAKDFGDISVLVMAGNGLAMTEVGVNFIINEPVADPLTWQIAQWEYAAASGAAVVRRNGTSVATSTYAGTVDNSTNLYVGSSQLDGAYFGGDSAEILAYNRILSATENQRLGRYLGRKYAITVS